MGTADSGGMTARVVEQTLDSTPGSSIDIVIGPQAPSLDYVQKLASNHSNLSLHVDSQRMADLMRDADLAIGAAGTTSWERCCLGLPSIAVVLADNQLLIANGLARAGAHIAIAAGDEQALGGAIRSLLKSQNRTEMAKRAAAITDGLGSTRVRDAMGSTIACESIDG
jgi:spore coat polysaccharide biosynthesis predicted glycosyltransferase SpsG